MDPFVKDVLQAAAWLGTAVGVLVAAVKFWTELKLGREQRDLQLRWQKAKQAKELIDDMYDAELAPQALNMLDYDHWEYDIGDGEIVTVAEEDYIKALRVKNLTFSDKEAFVRQAFDELFDYMARIEHYLQTDLVTFEDVRYPFDYYMPTINRNRPVFDAFLQYYRLDRTRAFLARMDRELGANATAVEHWRKRDADASPAPIGNAA